MTKRMKDIGGLVLFYAVIIVGVLLLNLRFAKINEIQNNDSNSVNVMMIN